MDSIQSLLKTWNVDDDVVKNFIDNGITVMLLKDITNQHLKELCPNISKRIALKKNIDEYLTSTSTTASGPESDIILDESLLENNDLALELDADLFVGRPPFPELELKKLLVNSPGGKTILEFYEKNNVLDNSRRNKLTDLIIRHLFTRIIKYHITYEEYNKLAHKITSLFPEENVGTYFVPPIKKSESIHGKSALAKGKLVDKVKNLLFTSGEGKRKASHTPIHKRIRTESDLCCVTEDKNDDFVWLKNNNEPWSKVIELWTSTFGRRRAARYENVRDFILDWPIIKDLRSEVLINLDFDQLYPKRNTKFFLNFQPFFNKLLQRKVKDLKDENSKLLIECLDSIEEDDKKIPAQITLLAHLIPPRGRLNKHSKFTKIEAVEGMLVQVLSPGDIDKKIEEQTEKALARKQRVQPYILLLGDLINFSNLYLVIDNVKYMFDSAGKAFDTLFKAYHVLDAQYPPASDHLYLAIQRCVYNVETNSDKIVPYMYDILKECAV